MAVFGPRGRRAVALVAGGLLAAAWGAYLATYGELGATMSSGGGRLAWLSHRTSPCLDVDLQGWALVGLTLAGAGVALFKRHRVALSAIPVVIAVAATAGAINPTAGPVLANTRYQTLALLSAAILAGYAIEVAVLRLRPARRRLSLALLAVAVAATLAGPLSRVTTPSTVDLEFRLLRTIVSELPPDSTLVVVPDRAIDGALKFPRFLSQLTPSHPFSWQPTDDDHRPERAGPRYYYHLATCSVLPGSVREGEGVARVFQDCERALERWGAHPVELFELPARPHGYAQFGSETVAVGLYDVDAAD